MGNWGFVGVVRAPRIVRLLSSMPLQVSSNTMHECDRRQMPPVVTLAPLPVVQHSVSRGPLRTREKSPLLTAVLDTSPCTRQ